MKRSILLSLMIIGAAVSLVVSASTFAVFTATDNETGNVTAGNLVIEVDGLGGGGVLQFNLGDALCPDDMAPGDDCDATVNVTNNGSVYAEITNAVVAVVSNTVGCLDANWSGTTNAVVGTQIDPAETESFTATVHLDINAPDACQNASATATLTVDVGSIPTP